MECGACVNQANQSGDRPIHVAALHGKSPNPHKIPAIRFKVAIISSRFSLLVFKELASLSLSNELYCLRESCGFREWSFEVRVR